MYHFLELKSILHSATLELLFEVIPLKIYWHNGRKNIIGIKVKTIRKQKNLTQKELAEQLQLVGYEFDRLTIGRIETGDRFVADYEVQAIATVLGVEIKELYQ